MTTKSTPSTRVLRTPAQRAQALLDAETKRFDKLTARERTLRRELADVEAERLESDRRRQWLAKSPDLKPAEGTSTTTTTGDTNS